ncbi:G5 domain-containing protein [Labedella endophytica]|uniref:G5 domain-containing protein n=1 Tax=Labedella endophytica TaxID=1523160 RepID=UPI001FB6C196|nr:G5 domain-containing protein [Labedella endophytica]
MTRLRIALPLAALAMSVGLLASGCSSSADDAGNTNASVRTLVDAEAQTPTPTPTPEVMVERVEVTEPIPYTSSTIDDPSMDAGVQRVSTAGANGTKTIVFEVTSEDGVEISRTAVAESVTVAPVNEVISVGSKAKVAAPPPAPAGDCDSNYSGACVPIASDVDCAGGSGNGPAYVDGPVRIVGSDIYDLDRDGDGIACD